VTTELQKLAQTWVVVNEVERAAREEVRRAETAWKACRTELEQLENKLGEAVSLTKHTAVFLLDGGKQALVVTYNQYGGTPHVYLHEIES
jgi:hypothetical protein